MLGAQAERVDVPVDRPLTEVLEGGFSATHFLREYELVCYDNGAVFQSQHVLRK